MQPFNFMLLGRPTVARRESQLFQIERIFQTTSWTVGSSGVGFVQRTGTRAFSHPGMMCHLQPVLGDNRSVVARFIPHKRNRMSRSIGNRWLVRRTGRTGTTFDFHRLRIRTKLLNETQQNKKLLFFVSLS